MVEVRRVVSADVEPARVDPTRVDPRVDPTQGRRLVQQAGDAVATVLRGNRRAVDLVLASVLARGHVLLEDVPGVGKTTLARSIAKVLGCSFSRVQFTADLLPADILGVQVLDPREGTFRFKRGPIFAELILADEINRATPKTQSAMLEAMAERTVTLEDTRHDLPRVFSVIATQNPVEHHGAYPLPESQLDRFMVRIALGYPDPKEERRLLLNAGEPERNLDALSPVLTPGQVELIQDQVQRIHLSDAVADYLLALVEATRRHTEVLLGCSPRGALAFGMMARAWAYLEGRDFVLPDDVKLLAEPVLSHRLLLAATASSAHDAARAVVDEIQAQTVVPR